MSVAEIKKAIYEKVEKISSQQQLDVMLEVLKKFESTESSAFDIDSFFEEARTKYENTLHKLTQ